MILLETKYIEIKNLTIHYLLENYKKENQDSYEELVDLVMPKHLRREEFEKCEQAFINIANWTNDKYYHRLDSLSKIALYYFIKENKDINKLKNNKKFQTELNQKLGKYKLNKKHILKEIYNYDWYLEMFLNEPFIRELDNLIKSNQLEEYLRNNLALIPLYQDILPKKIKSKFIFNENLYRKVDNLVAYIQENIHKGSLAYLFWDNNKPASEEKIQEVLKCILDAYFYKVDIDINREVLNGTGKIDFKFYKNLEEIIIMELKKASNSHLKSGFEVQLVKYMKASHCKRAYYVILCFNDEDINKATTFIKNRKNTEEYHEYIEIVILDLRLNNKIINNYNESIYNELDNNIDKYFKYITRIKQLNKKEEIIKYLKTIKNNYNKISNYEYKLEYIKKIHKVSTENRIKDFMKYDFYSEDFFYMIHKDNALREFIISFLSDITNENKFNEYITDLIDFMNTLIEKENPERITIDEVEEIFNFIKKRNKKLYNILKNLKLDIFLVEESSIEFNSSTIPSINGKNFKLVCTYMQRDTPLNKGYPIYVFFYLLGIILNWYLNKDTTNILSEFLEHMHPYTEGLSPNTLDAQVLFADSFAMYLVNGTKYNKYNPYKEVDKEIYDMLKVFFDDLIERYENNDII